MVHKGVGPRWVRSVEGGQSLAVANQDEATRWESVASSWSQWAAVRWTDAQQLKLIMGVACESVSESESHVNKPRSEMNQRQSSETD